MDRRPSVGHNIAIPHAALCQHRHSLQLNGDGSFYGKAGIKRLSTVVAACCRHWLYLIALCFHTITLWLCAFENRPVENPDSCSLFAMAAEWGVGTRRFSESDDDMATSIFTTPRGSVGGVSLSTLSSRASMQHDHVPHCSSKVGVVITSYRQSQRR
ncbi:hypothetical protein pipiens_007295 [Culex pipiens pipiens]|uniref:Uncharacterized protein n=1 Tax=Culex pipiens pipiens TaxID=38569 RepID=A0ABD1DLV8_CULPP